MKSDFSLKKIFNSFAFRISLKFAVIDILAIFLISLTFLKTVNGLVRHQRGVEVERSFKDIVRVLKTWDTSTEPQFNLPYYVSYTVYDEDFDLAVFTNDPLIPFSLPETSRYKLYSEKKGKSGGDLKIIYFSGREDFENLSKYHGGKVPNLKITTAIHADAEYLKRRLSAIPKALGLVSIIIILTSFFISFFIAKKTIEPVVRITERVKSNSTKIINAEFPFSRRNDEIDELSRTFNSLFAQVRKDFFRERQFSSDVSHELKTPLAVIRGQANLLLRWGKDDPVQLENSLRAIKDEAQYMQSIIENLLTISRYENGSLTPDFKDFSVRNLFELLENEFKLLNHQKKTVFEISCDEELKVHSDFEILRQIFTVFISNSMKFSFSDRPLKIKLSAFKDEKGLVLSESDNGPGFSEKDISEVFERFYMGNLARTREVKKNSTGLGLAIAKTMCYAIGAEISAGNCAEGGAKLSVTIPNFRGG